MRSASLPASSEPSSLLAADHACAADGRHFESGARADDPRILRRQLVQKRRLAHGFEHVEVVVAGRAVGAESERHAGLQVSSTGAVPLASFMLLSGLCDTPTLCLVQDGDLVGLNPDAVRGDDLRPPEAERVERGHRPRFVPLQRKPVLGFGFGQMDQQRNVVLGREVARLRQRSRRRGYRRNAARPRE